MLHTQLIRQKCATKCCIKDKARSNQDQDQFSLEKEDQDQVEC